MHILYFPTRFFPAISGGDYYMQRIAEEMKRQGNNVSIFTTNAIDFAGINGKGKKVDVKHKNFAQFKNLKVTRWETSSIEDIDSSMIALYIHRLSTKFNFPVHLISFFIKNGPILLDLIELILSEDALELNNVLQYDLLLKGIDFIHVTYLPYANLLYSLLIGLKLHIPCAVTPFLHFENIRYQDREIFQLLSYFDLIFACTEQEKKILIQNGINGENIKVLPMGVDIKKFEKDCRTSFQNLFFKPEEAIIFCGNKNYEKGALTILKSVPFLFPIHPNLTYIMIGASTPAYNYQLDQLKKEIPKVKIINISPDNLSGVYDPIKIGAFQNASIYCMPSRSDAYGIAYLEAWAVKIPVIAAKFPAMEEVINIGKTGELVEFDNPKALADIIIELLSNRIKRLTMGQNGYERIKINNNWCQITKKTHNFYQEIIGKKMEIEKNGQ